MSIVRTCRSLVLRFTVALIGAVALPHAALAQVESAGGIAQLRQFVALADSAEGTFEQVVIAKSGRRPQQASGRFAYQRPGLFHWEYDRPYRQVLVGDGAHLWSWDPDLNQVTVREMGDALGATPAAILFGQGRLEDNFELAEGGVEDGLAWVEARPKQTESGFESLRIGLEQGRLRRMEMRDHFGQTTLINFLDLHPNPMLAKDRFRFVPPAGADIIGDVPGALPGR
jgi:outer membrane lipoprotein carrier protein